MLSMKSGIHVIGVLALELNLSKILMLIHNVCPSDMDSEYEYISYSRLFQSWYRGRILYDSAQCLCNMMTGFIVMGAFIFVVAIDILPFCWSILYFSIRLSVWCYALSPDSAVDVIQLLLS